MVTDHQTIAVLLGIAWGTAVVGYRRIADSGAIGVRDREGVTSLRWWLDVSLVGGGLGVFLYLTDSYLASFVYGVAGVVLVASLVGLSKWTARRRRSNSRT